MARKEPKSLVIFDPETNAEITFSPEHRLMLESAKTQIKTGMAQMALGLKMIRDQKLYLLDSCDSMTAWLVNVFGQSARTGYRLLEAADQFAALPNAEDVLREPLSHLLTISRSKDAMEQLQSGEMQIEAGQVIQPDGSSIPLPVFAKQLKEELAGEVKKVNEKVQKLHQQMRVSKEEGTRLAQQLEGKDQEIESLNNTVRELMGKKDIDPKMIVLIHEKKEIIALLNEVTLGALDMLGRLSTIPHKLVDAEVAGHISRTISTIEASLDKARDEWAAVMYIPKAKSDPDLVPGAEN